MASTRDREAWSHIFKLYKSFPHLWDKNNINYGNRSMMTDGYKILTRVYREQLDKQASVGALRMKMKNLRTTYYRELRKIKQAKQKGEKYTPSLWYFENLNFLGTPRSNSTSGDNLGNNTIEHPLQESSKMEDMAHAENSTHMIDDLALENGDIETDLLPGPSTSQPNVNTRIEIQAKDSQSLFLNRQDMDTQKKTMKDEYWEVIGKSIGYQLRDLDKKQFTIVSKLISDAIYFGRLNKLTEVSHIEIGPSNYVDSTSPHYTPSGHYSSGFHAVDVLTNQPNDTSLKREVDVDEEQS